MMEVLFPVLLVAGIGLVAGLGLAIASAVMAVPKDEKAETIQEIRVFEDGKLEITYTFSDELGLFNGAD